MILPDREEYAASKSLCLDIQFELVSLFDDPPNVYTAKQLGEIMLTASEFLGSAERRFDFHASHAIHDADYDPTWRIYYPANLGG